MRFANNRDVFRQSICGMVMTFALTVSAVYVGPVQSQENPPSEKPTPVTTVDSKIPLENLAILVKPLTQEELVVESDGWRDLLKQNVQQIADLRIALKAEGGDAEDLLPLQEEKARLVKNLSAVLDELESKGGDVESYRKYIAALTGVGVEVKDASAAWVMLRGWLVSEQGGR